MTVKKIKKTADPPKLLFVRHTALDYGGRLNGAGIIVFDDESDKEIYEEIMKDLSLIFMREP